MWYNSIRKVGVSMRLIQKFETQTTRGMLSKAWVELDDGTQCLIKGNSMEKRAVGQEPYSEVIASRIGRLLGLPVLQYELIDRYKCESFIKFNGNIEHASICKSYRQGNNNSYMSFSEYAISLGYSRTDPFITYQKLGLNMRYLACMLALDAFVGNQDRHFGNFEVEITANSVRNAIMFDFGASLLAWQDSSYCSKVKRGSRLYVDSAKPFKHTHTEQMKFIKNRLQTQRILNVQNKSEFYKHVFIACQDVFDKMPKYRVEAIKNYLLNREMYLD